MFYLLKLNQERRREVFRMFVRNALISEYHITGPMPANQVYESILSSVQIKDNSQLQRIVASMTLEQERFYNKNKIKVMFFFREALTDSELDETNGESSSTPIFAQDDLCHDPTSPRITTRSKHIGFVELNFIWRL